MLKNARFFLFAKYQETLPLLESSTYYTAFAQEKITHSLQTLGAANFIIKHEAYFANQPKDFIELAKTAVLLHDIGRFEEVVALYRQSGKIDHGPAGASLLSKTHDYNSLLITLPVKHHGHIAKQLYGDEEYTNIPNASTKEQITKISSLVRDADKIANFNLMTNKPEIVEPIFVPFSNQVPDGCVSQAVAEEFLANKTITYANRRTRADCMLTYISWSFDINYNSSFDFCLKLNIIDKLFILLKKYNSDEQQNIKFRSSLLNFVEEKMSTK